MKTTIEFEVVDATGDEAILKITADHEADTYDATYDTGEAILAFSGDTATFLAAMKRLIAAVEADTGG